MRLGCSSKNTLHSRRNAGLIRSTFEDACFHACVGDAVLDVSDKHLGNQFRPAQHGAWTAIVEEEWHLVICVDSRRHDDLDLCLLRDLVGAPKAAAQSDYC